MNRCPKCGRIDESVEDFGICLRCERMQLRGATSIAPGDLRFDQLPPISTNGSQAGSNSDRYAGRILDVGAMLAEREQPIPWRCQDFAADSYLTLLAGKGKEGKSWLALTLACGVARGETVAGIRCTRGRALIFDAENGAKLISRRFRAAAITSTLDVQPVEAGGLRITDDLDWFRAMIVEQRANFVVFDSLKVLSSGAKENDANEMEPIITALKQLARETGAAIVLIHHRGRSAISEFRGSSVILDQTDMLFTLGRVEGDPEGRARRKLTTVGCRIEEEPEPRWLQIEADRSQGLVYVNEADPYEGEEPGRPRERDQHRDQVLALLDSSPRSGRSIAVALGRKPDDGTTKRLLRDLKAEGLAEYRSNGWVGHNPNSPGGTSSGPPPGNGSTELNEGGPSGQAASGPNQNDEEAGR